MHSSVCVRCHTMYRSDSRCPNCSPPINVYDRPSSAEKRFPTGDELISIERRRQQTQEGFSVPGDVYYTQNELIRAAGACVSYARGDITGAKARWPTEWGTEFAPWVKGHSRLKAFVIAGALVAAEIDRLIACGEPIE